MSILDCEPACVCEGDLSPADGKRYLALPFDVPPGTGDLRIDLRYEPLHTGGPQEIQNLIGITLLDPQGFRGNQHTGSNHKVVEIGPHGATPGFYPGPLPAGRWTLELDTFMVLPGAPCSYRAEVRLAPGPARAGDPPTWQPQPPMRQEPGCRGQPGCRSQPGCRGQPGWYRGDLHTHTLHSDGGMTVPQLLETARRRHLDFIALTDHNTVTGLHDPALAGCDLAIIPGMELTTYYGHAVALGIDRWVDWRTGHARRTIGDALAEVRTAGGLSIVAHPAALGDPVCTGCAWLYTDQMPGALDAVEVWNGAWLSISSNNANTLYIWQQWLNAGHRLPATAGTDIHEARDYEQPLGFNLIYARELSAAGLLAGLAQGHVMLSAGPELYLEAALADGRTAIMGDAVPWAAIRSLSVRCKGAPAGAQVEWIAGGEVVAAWEADREPISPPLPADARWALAGLRARDGDMLALTNPLYNIP